ncbi:MAG: PqqD family protein, partial [Candidatus Deferrimicrobiaceae bacterium]
VDGAIHQLNLVGAEIWTRINSINTVEKIAAEIAPLFHADPGEMQVDVMEFFKNIEGKGWVTLSSRTGPVAPGWSAR